MPQAMTFNGLRDDVRNYLERGASIATDPIVYEQIPKLINLAERRIARDLKIATSSGVPDFTGLVSVAPAASCGFAVNAPKSVPNNERPIASAINRVKIVPEAPTNVPAMINNVASRT